MAHQAHNYPLVEGILRGHQKPHFGSKQFFHSKRSAADGGSGGGPADPIDLADPRAR